jgi:hypothetical protein
MKMMRGTFEMKVDGAFQALGVMGFLVLERKTRLLFYLPSCRSKRFFSLLGMAFWKGPDTALTTLYHRIPYLFF